MTICPFCDRNPFEYVDVGVGSVPVAVTCCEFGDMFFRGARPEIENDVTMSADEFREIGQKLSRLQRCEMVNDKLAERLMVMAAKRSTETSFGWAHPDCETLQAAASTLRGAPEHQPDPRPVGVLSGIDAETAEPN